VYTSESGRYQLNVASIILFSSHSRRMALVNSIIRRGCRRATIPMMALVMHSQYINVLDKHHVEHNVLTHHIHGSVSPSDFEVIDNQHSTANSVTSYCFRELTA
jgi:hypothetical protein